MKNLKFTNTDKEAESGSDPTVTIAITAAPAAGQTLRFSLIVVDSNGIQSQPAFVDVPVVALPVAVIRPVAAVAAGSSIVLDASPSTPKGQISSFKWQLVAAPSGPLNPGGIVIPPLGPINA